MKHITILLAMMVLLFSACKKGSEIVNVPSGNIVVVNAVVGGAALTFNAQTITKVSNNSFAQYPLLAGADTIDLYNAATVPATLYYYKDKLPINSGDNYSLFLAGASPSAIDPILIRETYSNYNDSSCGVRFMNLSPNSPPISVNITGQPNGSEAASLVYKDYTDFKKYPATVANKTYAFQIKNATTGTTIASYTLTTPFFHNVTIVLRGLVGGSPAAGITQVNHP